jgi:hypothetical protein
MDGVVNGLSKYQWNGNPNSPTALNVNCDTTNERGDGGRVERSGVTSKSRELDRLGGHYHPKLRKVTIGGKGR